ARGCGRARAPNGPAAPARGRLRGRADGRAARAARGGGRAPGGRERAVKEQLALLPGYLTAHLQLSLAALLLAAAISVPLGVAVTRRRALEGPVLGFASAIQTIPSLALLAVMVPALAAPGARPGAGCSVSGPRSRPSRASLSSP